MDVEFPLWLRTTHLLNFLLLGILIRSGWEILASLPRLWWRNDAKPGTEWLRFTRQKLPTEKASTPHLWMSGQCRRCWPYPVEKILGSDDTGTASV